MENRQLATVNEKPVKRCIFHFPFSVCRWPLLSFLVVATLLQLSKPVLPTTTSPAKRPKAQKAPAGNSVPADLAASFHAFCEDWMSKLRARERDNLRNIKWESSAGAARGTYVGYSEDHKCELKESTQVGRIAYREFTYEKRGSSIAEAERSTPYPIEVYEATEIFHCENGKWTY